MTKTLPIFKRELKSYFTSPVAYVVIALFLVITGIMFSMFMSQFVRVSLQYPMYKSRMPNLPPLDINQSLFAGYLGNISVICLFLLPFLTMRLFAEEKRSGTAEILFTYPVKDYEVMLGKFLATGLIFVVMLAMTLLVPFLTELYGTLSWSVLLSGYLGLLLAGLAYNAIGMFFSSLTENQIIAAALTLVTLLTLWVIRFLEGVAGETFGKLMGYLSILGHQENFIKGIVDTGDVIYYLAFIFVGLFLTLRSLESRRWRA